LRDAEARRAEGEAAAEARRAAESFAATTALAQARHIADEELREIQEARQTAATDLRTADLERFADCGVPAVSDAPLGASPDAQLARFVNVARDAGSSLRTQIPVWTQRHSSATRWQTRLMIVIILLLFFAIGAAIRSCTM